jgi:hypothetical protein
LFADPKFPTNQDVSGLLQQKKPKTLKATRRNRTDNLLITKKTAIDTIPKGSL